MEILNHQQIKRKVRRLALQILENNLDARELYVGGINTNGQRFANMLTEELRKNPVCTINNFQISLSPASPLSKEVTYDMDVEQLRGKHIIIVDDVANTGRTLFYACKPLMKVVPGQLEMAVLVDRKHKSFPVYVEYVGLSLATTLGDDISVNLENKDQLKAQLV